MRTALASAGRRKGRCGWLMGELYENSSHYLMKLSGSSALRKRQGLRTEEIVSTEKLRLIQVCLLGAQVRLSTTIM